MHGTGIYHPNFATHPRYGLEGAMPDRIEIYRPTGESPEWTPGAGMADNAYELVYRGRARINSDQDWKARDRNFANELTSTEAVRVQAPIRGNELTDDKLFPFLDKNYKVVIIDVKDEALGWMKGTDLIVRNGLQASEKWLRSFVCDANTKLNGDGL